MLKYVINYVIHKVLNHRIPPEMAFSMTTFLLVGFSVLIIMAAGAIAYFIKRLMVDNSSDSVKSTQVMPQPSRVTIRRMSTARSTSNLGKQSLILNSTQPEVTKFIEIDNVKPKSSVCEVQTEYNPEYDATNPVPSSRAPSSRGSGEIYSDIENALTPQLTRHSRSVASQINNDNDFATPVPSVASPDFQEEDWLDNLDEVAMYDNNINVPTIEPEVHIVTRRSIIQTSPTLEMRAKLKECIELKDDEKLDALLQTITNFFPGKIEQHILDDAYQKLNTWQLEKSLLNSTNKPELSDEEIEKLRNDIAKAESEQFVNEIKPEVIFEAKKRLRRAEEKKAMIQDMKNKIKSAIDEEDVAKLENLIKEVGSKGFNEECKIEVEEAKAKIEEIKANESELSLSELEKMLESAMEKKKIDALQKAIRMAVKSKHKEELSDKIFNAKILLGNLEDREKMLDKQREKIAKALSSKDINTLDATLKEFNKEGVPEELKDDVKKLENALKAALLNKRIGIDFSGNPDLDMLDLDKVRKAVKQKNTIAFITELGMENTSCDLFKTLHKDLIQQAVEELDTQSIAELKSYSQPPPQIHKLLMSIYTILGEEDSTVKEWKEVKGLLKKADQMSLKNRLQNFDADFLTTGTAKKSLRYISQLNQHDLSNISQIAVVFYLWAKIVIEDKLITDGSLTNLTVPTGKIGSKSSSRILKQRSSIRSHH